MSLKIHMVGARRTAADETCASCGEPITNERVTYQGKVYHHGHQPGAEKESSKTAENLYPNYSDVKLHWTMDQSGWGGFNDGPFYARVNEYSDRSVMKVFRRGDSEFADDTEVYGGNYADPDEAKSEATRWIAENARTASKTADLAATGCPASEDGLHKWLRYTSDVLPITATCAYCGETAETGTKGGWGGWIGSKTALIWQRDNGGLSSNSPVYSLSIGGTVGAEVYESPVQSGQWFWDAWLADGIGSDGGPFEFPGQAQRAAEAWLAGGGATVVTGSTKVAFDEEAQCPQCGAHGDYADESGAPLVASPGAISPPLSWGGKLVCPNDGTVWQYVSEEKRDRDVRQFNDIHYSKIAEKEYGPCDDCGHSFSAHDNQVGISCDQCECNAYVEDVKADPDEIKEASLWEMM